MSEKQPSFINIRKIQFNFLKVMGNCESAEVAEQTAISKKIDKELYTPPVRMVQKLLLLGNYKFFEGINFPFDVPCNMDDRGRKSFDI
jgi:hypothetical protein